MQRPILLLSTPRSGSDWFAGDCLRWQTPDYFREYFNPSTNFARTDVLRLAFGSEADWSNLAIPWECQEDLCEYVYQATWRLDRFRFTKENYSAFKIGFFVRHFDCFALVGHRRNTFPGGSRPRSTEYWWLRYFQSLEFNRELLDPEIAGLVDRALDGPLDPRRKMIASQVIATHQTLRACLRYKIPILEYRWLLSIPSEAEVYDYLRDKVPVAAIEKGLPGRVIATRRQSDKAHLYDS